MKCITPFIILFVCTFNLFAQHDAEFPKGFVMHAKLHNGMVTNFAYAPDVYVGGMQWVPQITIAKHLLRGGIIGDLYYTGKKMEAAFGPTFSLKLKTFRAAPFGSAGNINLSIDHLWGTNKERLIGGGINLDLANKLVIALTVHRDYNLNTWWLQNTLGIRISKTKKLAEL